ncbi:hypothetical protein B296_00022494 [Ensete ventricosum]|uniref:Uncharacterized protein n=1 Tax=Ensete ventricosum TaxID=4639 RepID=A0A426ZB08_ENSVE|nr:hypothetical protein B296_00022494 [Ensete ventricosum]
MELPTRHGPRIKLRHRAKDWTMRWELVGSSLGDSPKGSGSLLGTRQEIAGGRLRLATWNVGGCRITGKVLALGTQSGSGAQPPSFDVLIERVGPVLRVVVPFTKMDFVHDRVPKPRRRWRTVRRSGGGNLLTAGSTDPEEGDEDWDVVEPPMTAGAEAPTRVVMSLLVGAGAAVVEREEQRDRRGASGLVEIQRVNR